MEEIMLGENGSMAEWFASSAVPHDLSYCGNGDTVVAATETKVELQPFTCVAQEIDRLQKLGKSPHITLCSI